MHHAQFLKEFVIFLIAAVVIVALFRRLKVSSVLGYLTAGLLIGPHALQVIDNIEWIQIFGNFGVMFLMFAIGLKTPLQRFKTLGPYVFGMGSAQVLITGTFLALITHYFVPSVPASIFIGTALALSSTAVAMQVLSERGESASRYGRVSFSVLLLQDLTVIVLLVWLARLKEDGNNLNVTIVQSIDQTALYLLFIIFIGRVILKPIYRLIASLNNQELFVATTLLVVFSTAFITAYIGLSMELGAFLAGLLLAETEYRHQIEADIQPYHGLLLGVFFMSMGMNIDLGLLHQSFGNVICIIIMLVCSKAILMTAIGWLFNLSLIQSLRVALLLSTGGEFVFVLFDPAVEAKIIDKSLSDLLSLSVALSMVLTPFLASLGKAIEDRIAANQTDASLESAEAEISDLKQHVIIAGFGRLGKVVAQILAQEIIPFVAIDQNMARVSEGRMQGFPVFFGDGKRANVMRTLKVERAIAVVVCLDKTQDASRMTMMLRRTFPNIEVCVRLHEKKYEAKLAQVGAVVVRPENLEPSLQLATETLKVIGTPLEQVGQIISQFRDNYFQAPVSNSDDDADD